MKRFAGKVVVVTGAASGIGRSIALAFAAEGATVAVSDIDADKADVVVQEIAEAGGAPAAAFGVDVGDSARVQEMADAIFERWGRVDVLVNNAGVSMRPNRAIWDGTPADFAWLMQVNYLGVIHGILAFVPRMRQQDGHKHMVNTSSMSTLRLSPGYGMYLGSKAAVDAVSTLLRRELADHGDDFGVSVLHPGPVATNIATSERLRAEGDRSEVRGVTAYDSGVPKYTYPYTLEPEAVGPLVVDGVLAGDSHIVTHPVPVTQLLERVDDVVAGGGGVVAALAAGGFDFGDPELSWEQFHG